MMENQNFMNKYNLQSNYIDQKQQENELKE